MTRRTLEHHPALGSGAVNNNGSHEPVLNASNEEERLTRSAPYPQSLFSLGLGMSIPSQAIAAATTALQPPIQATKKLIYTIVKADLLIPGDGEPQEHAALVVEDKTIVWVGRQDDIPEQYTSKARKTHSVPYLMPGLWDCHVHLMAGGEEQSTWPAYLAVLAHKPHEMGARLSRSCWEYLQQGCTSVRDLAGFGCEIASAVEDGTIVGPNIYSAGAAISQLSGHGDVYSMPAGDVLLTFGVSQLRPGHYGTEGFCIVDGEHECRRAVRLQIRRGAKCIKVLASGGVMSSDDDPVLAQLSPGELETLVDEATRLNRAVAAHCHGKPGILAAVNAGVTTIEHGSYTDEECIRLMKEKDVILVATRDVYELLLPIGKDLLPEKIWKKLKETADHSEAAYKLAIQSDVQIALGTDTTPERLPYEMSWAVKAGLSNLEAIKAATANAPLTLKGQAPKSGQLKVGYDADFIGVTKNPAQDVSVLHDKDNVKWVWKGGQAV